MSDDLFSRKAYQLVRSTDPHTSLLAAEKIIPKLSKLQTEVYSYIVSCGRRGATLLEIEDHFGNHGSTYRTRVAELCGKGKTMGVRPPLVVNSGLTRHQKGRDRTVWVSLEYRA